MIQFDYCFFFQMGWNHQVGYHHRHHHHNPFFLPPKWCGCVLECRELQTDMANAANWKKNHEWRCISSWLNGISLLSDCLNSSMLTFSKQQCMLHLILYIYIYIHEFLSLLKMWSKCSNTSSGTQMSTSKDQRCVSYDWYVGFGVYVLRPVAELETKKKGCSTFFRTSISFSGETLMCFFFFSEITLFEHWAINSHSNLGGGFKCGLFPPLPGEMIQFDECFQMGWNHQLENGVVILWFLNTYIAITCVSLCVTGMFCLGCDVCFD